MTVDLKQHKTPYATLDEALKNIQVPLPGTPTSVHYNLPDDFVDNVKRKLSVTRIQERDNLFPMKLPIHVALDHKHSDTDIVDAIYSYVRDTDDSVTGNHLGALRSASGLGEASMVQYRNLAPGFTGCGF